MEQIAMPQLGETVTEGTVLRWLKELGERVEIDDGLFEVSTEKVDTEVPSAFAGFLRRIIVQEGDTVPVGTVLALLTAGPDDPLDQLSDEAQQPAATVRLPEGPDDLADGGRAQAATTNRGAVARIAIAAEHGTATDRRNGGSGRDAASFLSPAVRKLLADHGLDPSGVNGSGRDGRITRNDVLAAVANGRSASTPTLASTGPSRAPMASAAPPTAGPDDEVIEFTRARRNTATNMLRSIATSAHALVVTEVDYEGLEHARKETGLSYLPFVARAVIDAIVDFPNLNASVGADELMVHPQVNLGIAVDVDFEALVVPVVAAAGGLRLGALAAAIADVAGRARAKRIAPDELVGGTFTITNVGAYGTLITAPIINQPQVAILSTDAVKMRPVAVQVDGTWGIAVHPVGSLCLSFDHRAIDGAYASAFLARVRDLLQTRDWTEE